jgi:hypothetical protein
VPSQQTKRLCAQCMPTHYCSAKTRVTARIKVVSSQHYVREREKSVQFPGEDGTTGLQFLLLNFGICVFVNTKPSHSHVKWDNLQQGKNGKFYTSFLATLRNRFWMMQHNSPFRTDTTLPGQIYNLTLLRGCIIGSLNEEFNTVRQGIENLNTYYIILYNQL